MKNFKIIVNALNTANKNGVFNLEESATILLALSDIEKQLEKCSACCQNDKAKRDLPTD